MTNLFLALAAIGSAPLLVEADLDRIVAVAPDQPGCAVAVVRDGRLALAKGYGLADLGTRRPVTADTTFNVASLTKQFTGMAVALLIADGKLRESDDIRTFLPELRDYGTPIRIANLLNHSSGLRNHMALAAFQPGDHLPTHEEALKLVFRQSSLNFSPGTRHQYESPNYVLLAEIVARVSGMSFEQFLQRRIFAPLGMTATAFLSPTLARAYAKGADGRWELREKVNRARGSSGLLSSVSDFARWMINYDSHQVGGGEASARMLSTSRLADGSPLSYRFGLIKEFDHAGVKGLTRISHGGQTAAYRSAFSYFPGRGHGHVAICNHPKNAQAIDAALIEAFVAPGAATPAQAAAEASSPSLLGRSAGVYYASLDDDLRHIGVADGKLTYRAYGQDYPLRHLVGDRFSFDGVGTLRFSEGRMEEMFDGQARLVFARLPPFAPQPLSPLTGTYRSGDVDGAVALTIAQGKLTLAYPAGTATLRQVGRDHFASPDEGMQSVRFVRGRGGGVVGLSLSYPGITRLRFARAER